MDLAIFKTLTESQETLCLATILHVKGSSPRHAGTKMLFGEKSGRLGTIGGGSSEAGIIEACRQCLRDRRPALLEVKALGADPAGAEMICGGRYRVLVEPVENIEPYRQATARLQRGERVLFVKRLLDRPDAALGVETALLDESGELIDGRLDEIAAPAVGEALGSGRPRFVEERRTYYEVALPEEKLLILGGGHVGQALAAAAQRLAFQVTVADDRREVIAAAHFPDAVRTVVGDFAQAIAQFPFDASTYVAVLTRTHQLDLECLRTLMKHDYRYVGLMGSLRKTRFLTDQLLADGFDPIKVDALCAPIGLDIGAETPQEIAVSILGEMIAFRRNAKILAQLRQVRAERRAAVGYPTSPADRCV